MSSPTVAAVVDTNVLISALIGRPSPATDVLSAFQTRRFSLVTSEPLLRELRLVTLRPEVSRYFEPARLVELWTTLAEGATVVTPSSRVIALDDPVDEALFSTAEAADAQCVVVTGDHRLLSLKKVEEIAVLSPREFVRLLEGRPSPPA